MAATTHKKRRFRLAITNAAEDVPRLMRAWGRCCDGEVALVMRPVDGAAALVHIGKDGSARSWQCPQGDGLIAPLAPEAEIAPKKAVGLIKDAQKSLPKEGPITLRGQWRGWLYCDGKQPRVELKRKLATYAVLTIESHPGEGWAWTVERTDKWFSEPGADEGEADSLTMAIERGLANAMGLLGKACSFRDSRRRAAFDEGWAERHPIKAARESKDPTERLKVKEKKGKKKAAKPRKQAAATPPAKPRKTKKPAQAKPPIAQRAPTKKRKSVSSSEMSDAQKDQLLMASFADALKSALAEV